MKAICSGIGFFIGFLLVAFVKDSYPYMSWVIFIGCPILGGIIGNDIDNERAEEERIRKDRNHQRKLKAQSLAEKYPEATRHYFKTIWNIDKSNIYDWDITDDKVDILLALESIYEEDEEKCIAENRVKAEAEREAAIRTRRIKEMRELEERRSLPYSLPACVSSWYTHANSSIKHKWCVDYYPYTEYKDYADSSMRYAWNFVWNFKKGGGVGGNDYKIALENAIIFTKHTLKTTFGTKVKYLTLVCLATTTAQGTKDKFGEFSKRLCEDLEMENGMDHIRIVSDGIPDYLGGTGEPQKQYDVEFFRGKYVILFDDVRTNGYSLEQEKRRLNYLGAKVIAAITIAQIKP